MGWAGRVHGGEVAFARVHSQLVTVFFGGNVDGAILAVALEESRFVGNQIAAADDLLQVGETAVETAR